MPVTLPDDTLWEATSHATTTSVVVTHPDAGGTTEGSTVLVYFRAAGSTSMTGPANWYRDFNGFLVGGLYAFRLDSAGAGETSWTFTRGGSGNTAWTMREQHHLAVDSFEVVSAGTTGTNATGTTRSTASTALNAGSSGMAVALFGSTKASSGDTHSWASYTNGFTERIDYNPAGVAGMCIAIADRTFSTQSTFETTATFTTNTGSPAAAAVVLVYRSSDADINAPIDWFTGFEFGTHGGISTSLGAGTSLGGTPVFGVNYSIIAGAAKSGGYGLEVVNSASNHAVQPPSLAIPSFVFSGAVKPVSGTGTPIAIIFVKGGDDLWLIYDVTNEKFGVHWSTTPAGVVWQTGTTPFGTYPYIQIRCRANGSIHHVDWWIETGTGDGFQTSPADLTGAAPSPSTLISLGSAVSQTATFHYDDIVYSRHHGAWPLGVHTVSLLTVDPAGTPTISGTSGNFQTFASNGTLTAWNATTARGAVDEVPPTVSASADGVVQISAAASDYAEFPMSTLTLDPNEIIAGVRALAPMWSGTGSGTTPVGIYGYDGLTETTIAANSIVDTPGAPTAVSATAPVWRTAMWSGAASGAWTPTRLNAAALRVGKSTVARDSGVSALYLEVATRTITSSFTVHRLTDDEDPEVDAAVVSETLHPYNSGVRVFTVSNDNPTRTAQFDYTIGGVAQTPVVVAPLDPPVEVVVGAEAFGEVDSTSFTWQ